MTDSVRLIANEIIELISSGSVDKAVIEPFARSYSIADLCCKLESLFYAFVAEIAAVIDELDIGVARVTQDIVRIRRYDCDLRASR